MYVLALAGSGSDVVSWQGDRRAGSIAYVPICEDASIRANAAMGQKTVVRNRYE